MFFPAIVSDPKRRSKVVADRLFCVGCLVLCATGPALLVLGTLLFAATDERSANIDAYNAAVEIWNGDGGGLQRFGAASFDVKARRRGSIYNLTRVSASELEPFSEVRSAFRQPMLSLQGCCHCRLQYHIHDSASPGCGFRLSMLKPSCLAHLPACCEQ